MVAQGMNYVKLFVMDLVDVVDLQILNLTASAYIYLRQSFLLMVHYLRFQMKMD